MSFFGALQGITAGKTPAEIEALTDDMERRIGGRLGAYHLALKALGAKLRPSLIGRRRSFRFNSIHRRDYKPGAPTPQANGPRRPQ
ncbi:hypothetical protein [Dongia sedimenti]|uniref:Uncharacterized protein n=1 Tax=Dongia sedimenti TaxID=3064282 RepID=A0ABU0YV90_9PROT|nr:hypothetical protein [Rhodospirillaceae bacterium R-7]